MPRINEANNNIEIELIGSNIRRIRQMRDMKAEEVARRLGLSKAAYSDIENNKCRTRLERLQQLADIFKVHYTQIINFNEDYFLQAPMPAVAVNEEEKFIATDVIQSFIRQLEVKDEIIRQLNTQITFLQKELASRQAIAQ
jgi:transcriptional regulator with XRE-family HTH domain